MSTFIGTAVQCFIKYCHSVSSLNVEDNQFHEWLTLLLTMTAYNNKCMGLQLKDYDMMAHWMCINFVRCWKPSQNSRHKNGKKKSELHRRPTNTRSHRAEFSYLGNMVPGTC